MKYNLKLGNNVLTIYSSYFSNDKLTGVRDNDETYH